jgi:tRNA-specific 2-thiouridylase
MNKRVVVAMSGGVDSSVVAALLKEDGFDVIGITMQIWPEDSKVERFGGCCSIEAAEDARRVANKIDIPHYMLNFRKIFEEKVINYFCEEYKEGRTPNPCIRCNQFIKFDILLKKAGELDADFIATGHYARIEYSEERKRYLLKRGTDEKKDQSYVLYGMTQEQLAYTLMPLGSFTKNQTREMANKFGLSVADKQESQEICFIPDNNYGRFLKERLKNVSKQGSIVNKEGKVLGVHQGVIFYTIGQRKGLGIGAPHPLYVIDINKGKNEIVVGNNSDLLKKELIADNLNFILFDKLTESIKVKAKIRYLSPKADAVVYPLENRKVKVVFDKPERAVTPGQAVVFYDGDFVVGGGTILRNT